MLKILVIAEGIGYSACGIVYERIISELSKSNQVDVLTCLSNLEQNTNINTEKINNIIEPKCLLSKWKRHLFFDQISYILMGRSIREMFYSKYYDINTKQYDIVLSMCSVFQLFPLELGDKLVRKYGGTLACYFVDPVPMPAWWLKGGSVKDGLMKYIRWKVATMSNKGIERHLHKIIGKVSYWASSNSCMLSYQMQYLPKSCNFTSVLLTPNDGKIKLFPKSDIKDHVFLYTGNLYGLRKSEYLISGFAKLLEKYPNSYLYFVGTAQDAISNCPSNVLDHIKFFSFTKDLAPFYAKATALLDIDAAIDNDVFLSSKITNYLLINRPIISETGRNSPSRQLFADINSILQCNHSSEDLYKAMVQSIEHKFDYSDRKNILYQFTVEGVVNKFLEELKHILY